MKVQLLKVLNNECLRVSEKVDIISRRLLNLRRVTDAINYANIRRSRWQSGVAMRHRCRQASLVHESIHVGRKTVQKCNNYAKAFGLVACRYARMANSGN